MSIKSKMRGRKLRSGVHWQGAMEKKTLQQTGVKQGLGTWHQRTKMKNSTEDASSL
jgi:hypothetical protein